MDTVDRNDEQDFMPFEGMKFKSVDDAFNFYNSYAKMKGFGIRRGAQVYGMNSMIVKKIFLCAKQGQKRMDDPREIDRDVKRRYETREGCMARMVIKINKEGEWIVHSFEDNHSHMMATPSKVRNIRSHKQLSEVSKRIIHGLSECGVGPSKISRVLNHVSDGVTEGGYTSYDCSNQLAKSRQSNMGQQFWAVHQYFQSKVGTEEGFFFKMQVDENYSVRSVFWADMRSRQAYMQFGDVLVFDVTYNTNTFKMPFAPFTGVNHHRQSTLFGCALLADETKDTFNWLFATWLECMWGRAPQCIITDQDGGIKDAISKVFPQTRHRFCSWHIAMNGKNHLRELGKHEDFKKDYYAWRFAETPKECEDQWVYLKEKYEIEDGSWLHQMYIIRENWLNAYLKDWFFAGMSSSQRSESINAFFDGYVNSQTSVSDFVHQYEQALIARRRAEALEDHKCMQSKAAMHVGDPMEQMARQVYTTKVFVLFREQYKHALLYSCHETDRDDWKTVYKLARKDAAEKYELVTFSSSPEISMECSCKKFEGDGILCSHILRLMLQKDMGRIPDKYILFRWTIGARYASSATLQTQESHLPNITPHMLFTYQSAMSKISNSISRSPRFWNHAMPVLKHLVDDFDKMSQEEVDTENVECGQHHVHTLPTEVNPGIVFVDPPIMKHKGRPKGSTRLRSGVEISQASQSRGRGRPKSNSQLRSGVSASHNSEGRRRCGNCGNKGHYSTTCPQNKGKQSQSSNWSEEDISENEEEEDISLTDNE